MNLGFDLYPLAKFVRSVSEHVALAVSDGDVVLRLRLDADGQRATVDVDTRDVDEVWPLDDVLEVLERQLPFEVEDDRLTSAQLELSDLVAIACCDSCNAVTDTVHDADRRDFYPYIAIEAVDAPSTVVGLGASSAEEVDGAAVNSIVLT